MSTVLDDCPIQSLDNSIALYVHKLIADRVQSHLLQVHCKWNLVGSTSGGSIGSPGSTRKRPLVAEPVVPISTTTSSTANGSCSILTSEHVTGVSKLRRGYHLMLYAGIPNASVLVSSLPPMARKNISWACKIQYQINLNPSTSTTKTTTTIGTTLFSTLAQFVKTDHALRVDVHPRSETERICLSLQKQAAADPKQQLDPFEGPINMTLSATKCTHRMVVLLVENIVYWGIMDKTIDAQLMMTRFNHQATDEMTTAAHQLANDNNNNGCIGTTSAATLSVVPLSRAYYKLQQVWQNDLLGTNGNIPKKSGLDLGASPGGWTQVLIHLVQLPRVVAIDPGKLAHGISLPEQVKHVQHAMESPQAALEIRAYGQVMPYSHIVCDASVILHAVFDKIIATCTNATTITTTTNTPIFALPSCWVITIKLPFKTPQSLARHMARARECAPLRLEEIKCLIYPKEHQNVVIRYTWQHLMANSDSERTLIAIMEETTPAKEI